MNTQIKKGLLEYCVLSQLQGGESYGYQMIKDISEYISISESTLYPILRRLEAEGLVQTRNVEHNNRIRRYFSLTEEGKMRLHNFVEERYELIRVIEFISGKEQRRDE
ncbi:MAG: PadR family transcriptional regulator [Lachnospiraceae bacterium]|nr:PadR family transcriptional regulator [Lachnospiraceae bacterium]